MPNDRLRIEVEDECGGLPPGREEDLFLAYVQKGADRLLQLEGSTARNGASALSGRGRGRASMAVTGVPMGGP